MVGVILVFGQILLALSTYSRDRATNTRLDHRAIQVVAMAVSHYLVRVLASVRVLGFRVLSNPSLFTSFGYLCAYAHLYYCVYAQNI